ncbi:TIR domain-containing protein [Novosphingobium aquiterrae]|uniref:TIR domain-containing protein n=1 Tax=Novosphingobium aquiterrae TaxID=624388 RepID=A0ABV6PFU7_9SPHN
MTGDDTSDAAADRPVRVFLSYSRKDRTRAIKVVNALEANGLSVWWDGMLEVGQAFAHSTETALETADAVVVLWSQTAIQSHWVRDEATRGRDRGCMVPVSLDGAQPPLGFRQIQYIKLDKWRGKANAREFVDLVHAIHTTAGSPNSQLNFSAAAAPASRGLSRRGVLALGASGAALLGGLAVWKGGWLTGQDILNSVAVLPFRNLSGDPAQVYFSDGLSEELRTMLSLNRGLEVAAETSSSQLSEQGKTPGEIADALKVAYVLDGSVRRAGDLLRITARLIDGKTGFEKWAQSFDRKADDVLAVQSEIATYVADALAAQVTTTTAGSGRTGNAKAFDAYLRGRALIKQAASEQTDRAGLAAFEQAVALDPKFALAHASRATALAVIASSYAAGGESAALVRKALEAARMAVRLAPDMAEGQFALGYVLAVVKLDLRGAQLPYSRAVELGFGNADILTAYGDFATNIGRFDDARKTIDRALRLDPVNPSVQRSAALLAFFSRDYAAAQTAFSAALALNTKVGVIHGFLGHTLLITGKTAEALDHYGQEPLALLRLTGQAIAEMKLYGEEAGEARLAELIKEFGTNSAYQQVQIFAQWGRRDAALAALDQAMTLIDSGLAQLRNDPLLDPIRPSPRMAAALQKLGFS